jgi:hypothetical protein
MVQLKLIYPNLQVPPPTFSARIFSSENGNESLIIRRFLLKVSIFAVRQVKRLLQVIQQTVEVKSHAISTFLVSMLTRRKERCL